MAKLRIMLNTVYCIETEDLVGADEFYVVAALARPSADPELKGVFRGIWEFNNGETMELNEILFEETVDPGETVVFKIWCLDRDAAEEITDEEIARAAGIVRATKKKVDEDREASGKPPTDALSAALWLINGIFQLGMILVQLDKDDLLGEDEAPILVPFPVTIGGITVVHPYPYNVPMPRAFRCRYDGCNYVVVYTITCDRRHQRNTVYDGLFEGGANTSGVRAAT